MKHFRTIVIAFALACAPFYASGQSTASPLVDQVIDQLALSHRITGLPANLAGQFEQNPFRLSEQVNENWLQAFKEAYSKDQLMRDYRAILKEKLSNLPVEELQTWLNKPNTKKMARARKEHYSLQGKRKQIVAMYELEKSPARQDRRELLSEFADVMIPANSLIESTVIVFQSVINSLDALSSRLNFTEAQMNMLVTNFRQQEPNHIQQMKEQGLPVKFHGVPSETIAQSLDFWQTETGRTLAKAIHSSLQQTYKKAGQRLSDSVDANNQ